MTDDVDGLITKHIGRVLALQAVIWGPDGGSPIIPARRCPSFVVVHVLAHVGAVIADGIERNGQCVVLLLAKEAPAWIVLQDSVVVCVLTGVEGGAERTAERGGE